ncbi:histone deacetylase [Acinetobacter sp. ANC 4910]|uniref:histone deacetylase n=1 Tax=Acinetobacter sp. ANC 4910 TaxID=2529850 RepID=UPI00103C6BBB|nr:histone deacetylase [Acinetobacter sp. ANC 4910]TCB36894.1 histone deacetylase [Acinetobacter sp. ANC 4910]
MLQVCYSPQYFAQTHTNSMEKLTAVAEALKPLGITKFHAPDPLAIDILKQLHAPEYVDAFHTGTPEKMATFQGFKPWNTQLRDAVYQINAGQILAAELAWKHQISANIAQGFHHAIYDFGSSFCTFNGLALIAQKFPNKRIFVLDCDQHGGNGTAEFTKRYDNLFNYSIYGLAFGCPTYERSETCHVHKHNGNFSQYILAIHQAFKRAIEWNADLIIYQAGMDCHQDDPCGSSWFSTELIEKRDEMIFRLAKKHQIPLMFVLAGGYQALPELVQLHLSTFKTAHQIYY